MLRESTSLRHFAQMKVQIFRIIAVDNIPERFGEIERLRMRGRLTEVELRERKQTVHERFQLGFLGVNRLRIARPRCFVLRHAVARGPEFVRSRIADGRVQIAVPP